MALGFIPKEEQVQRGSVARKALHPKHEHRIGRNQDSHSQTSSEIVAPQSTDVCVVRREQEPE